MAKYIAVEQCQVADEHGDGHTFAQFAAARRSEFCPEGEVEKTPEEIQFILESQQATIAFCDRLGVDVRGRMPCLADYHFFADQKAYEDAVLVLDPHILRELLPAGGVTHPFGGVLWVRQPDPLRQELGIVHEGWHFISRLLVKLRPSETIFTDDGQPTLDVVSTLSGCSDESFGVNELLTDIAAVDILRAMGRKEMLVSYDSLVILGGELMKKAAQDLRSQNVHVTPLDIHDLLLEGTLTGDDTGIATIKDLLTADQAAAFLGLGPRESIERVREVARILDLPDAVRNIDILEAYRNDTTKTAPEILDWVQLRGLPRFTKATAAGEASAQPAYVSGSTNLGGVGYELERILNLAEVSKQAAMRIGNTIVEAIVRLEGLSEGSAHLGSVSEAAREALSDIRQAARLLLDSQVNVAEYMDRVGASRG